ncbi:Vitellogenin-1 [Eumeta japonica]|uniref:Vitellogenin-1 n=1 Tax=Eumeta variegata TaxID=151549 RepID=A0A4C1SIW7_EUMVA|nr:Vitellogenin-1 [Eumeta japonica]
MVTPDINEMYFQLRTACSSISVPIQEAAQILDIEEFNVNNPVVLFITGWTSTIESDSITHMVKAFNCRGGYNFCLGAHSRICCTLFSTIYWRKIQRITGLDPANPCFGSRSLAGLQRGDAKFVDIIHTNPGVLGTRDALGDIDFYPQGYAPIKPGCRILGCSHKRAWKYYAESVYPGHELDFVATHCTSLRDLENGLCDGPEMIMGLQTNPNANGTHMLSVNRQIPWRKLIL